MIYDLICSHFRLGIVGHEGKISCKLTVQGSGSLNATLKIFMTTKNSRVCLAEIQQTEQGSIFWPTSYAGANTQVKCPYGGSTPALGYRPCLNSSWGIAETGPCFFGSNTTRTLQEFMKVCNKEFVQHQ